MYKLAPGCESPIAILASDSMAGMAKNVSEILNKKYGDGSFPCSPFACKVFPNGELYPNLIETPVKNKKIFLFEDLRTPDPNTALIRLVLSINALTLSTVDSITLVVPYLCYSRQDRKDKPRVPISAKVVAKILQMSPKVERLITMDMHSDQGQGFYDIPVDNLYGSIVLSKHFKSKHNGDFRNVIAIAPDKGAGTRTGRFAKYCHKDMPILILDKRRDEHGIEILKFDTDLTGKHVLLFDDEVASGETSIKAAKALLSHGAKTAEIIATHWVACPSGGASAEEKFRKSGLSVTVTNTCPRPHEYLEQNPWLTVVPIDDLLAEVIDESSLVGGSISKIFG